MLKWMSNLLCEVGWHHGAWVYDSEPAKCAQARTCLRCSDQGYRVRHDVKHWESDGWTSRTESGVCIRCEHSQTRLDPRLGTRRR